MELHVFSDASVKAIAAVVYLKVSDDSGMNHVGFIMGKAKLALLRKFREKNKEKVR